MRPRAEPHRRALALLVLRTLPWVQSQTLMGS